MSSEPGLVSEIRRHARVPVPALLGMSVVLGLFNAPEWTLAAMLPPLMLAVGMGVLICLFGLIALAAGLYVARLRASVFYGWLAGLMVGFAGIAFMLWYFAAPAN